MVVMAGRPLTIERDLPYADAVLYNFHPGTMGGLAIMNLLYGKANPSGKLPVTFVREVGQIPMYYNHNNTGRPAQDWITPINDIPLEAPQTSLGNTSFYLDSGKDPLFAFGYGLSYSTFEYSDLNLSSNEVNANDTLTVTANDQKHERHRRYRSRATLCSRFGRIYHSTRQGVKRFPTPCLESQRSSNRIVQIAHLGTGLLR